MKNPKNIDIFKNKLERKAKTEKLIILSLKTKEIYLKYSIITLI